MRARERKSRWGVSSDLRWPFRSSLTCAHAEKTEACTQCENESSSRDQIQRSGHESAETVVAHAQGRFAVTKCHGRGEAATPEKGTFRIVLSDTRTTNHCGT